MRIWAIYASTIIMRLLPLGKSNPEIRIKLFWDAQIFGLRASCCDFAIGICLSHAILGDGTVIMHHALVNAHARVGQIASSTRKSTHWTWCYGWSALSCFNRGAIVNGGVQIKPGTFYGSNATCKEAIMVGGFIKAGSVVKWVGFYVAAGVNHNGSLELAKNWLMLHAKLEQMLWNFKLLEADNLVYKRLKRLSIKKKQPIAQNLNTIWLKS